MKFYTRYTHFTGLPLACIRLPNSNLHTFINEINVIIIKSRFRGSQSLGDLWASNLASDWMAIVGFRLFSLDLPLFVCFAWPALDFDEIISLAFVDPPHEEFQWSSNASSIAPTPPTALLKHLLAQEVGLQTREKATRKSALSVVINCNVRPIPLSIPLHPNCVSQSDGGLRMAFYLTRFFIRWIFVQSLPIW